MHRGRLGVLSAVRRGISYVCEQSRFELSLKRFYFVAPSLRLNYAQKAAATNSAPVCPP